MRVQTAQALRRLPSRTRGAPECIDGRGVGSGMARRGKQVASSNEHKSLRTLKKEGNNGPFSHTRNGSWEQLDLEMHAMQVQYTYGTRIVTAVTVTHPRK